MNINKTTLKIQASYNYQVASIEAEIEGYTETELQNYTQYLVNTCSQTVKNISNAVGQPHPNQAVQSRPAPVQTQVTRTPVNTQGSSYRTAYPQNNERTTAPVKLASSKQIDYLRALGYTGSTEGLTFLDADNILKELKGQR